MWVRLGLPGVSASPLSSYRDKQVIADQPIRGSVMSQEHLFDTLGYTFLATSLMEIDFL